MGDPQLDRPMTDIEGWEDSRMREPVFLLGAPRSGTSLTYSVLLLSDRFPVYRGETHLLDVCKPIYGDISNPRKRKRFLAAWVESSQFHRSGLDVAEFLNLASRPFRHYGEFLRLFMEQVALSQGKERWLEKTPGHIFEARNLLRWFPDARFLHVIRDGRDVALSLRNKGWLSNRRGDSMSQLISAARLWYRAISHGRWLQREAGERYLEFRYEDLVRRDPETLQRINHFIGSELDYARIDAEGGGALNGGDTTYQQKMIGLSAKGCYRWEREMSPEEQRVITHCLRPVLAEKGYRVDLPPPSGFSRFRADLSWWGNALAIPAKYWLRHYTPLGRYARRTLDYEGNGRGT